MVLLHNYYLSIILEVECSIHLKLVVNYVITYTIELNDLQIVQFIKTIYVGLQLDWNGV
jgi:hypothetical protein